MKTISFQNNTLTIETTHNVTSNRKNVNVFQMNIVTGAVDGRVDFYTFGKKTRTVGKLMGYVKNYREFRQVVESFGFYGLNAKILLSEIK